MADGAHDREDARPSGRWFGFGSLKSGVLTLCAIAAALSAVIALAFTIFPSAKPCDGNKTAEFTDIDVQRRSASLAVVSYTVQSDGYRGDPLSVTWSLLRQLPDGTRETVIEPQPASVLEPSSCSADKGGSDLDVVIPGAGKYLIVLELRGEHTNQARITRKAVPLDTT